MVPDPADDAVPGGLTFSGPPPLALYVHWPWCVRKCPYCDFNSHAVTGPLDEDAYLAALDEDLAAVSPMVAGRPIISVFIGGGTPSLMSSKAVAELLALLARRLPLTHEAEITLEANPGTSDAARFAAYRAAGINRLSLGVQSFDDRLLAAIGRIHDARSAQRALEIALRHFPRVNVDLMVALPGQSLAQVERDLALAIDSAPGQISAYQLTLEPHTLFYHQRPSLPDDDLAALMQQTVDERLAAAGFRHYEISAFARPGEECVHNLNYWTFGDYLGLGAGAHSKLTLDGQIWREARPRHPVDYLARARQRHWQTVAEAEVPGEFMMNALRLIDGVPAALFVQRTGLPWQAIAKSVRWARRAGLLVEDEQRLAPTALGARFLNRLIQYFL